MNNNIINNLKETLSSQNIDFLSNVPKEIFINKKGQALYYKIFELEINKISNFIYNIPTDEVFLIVPFITISNTIKDPYICLSSQFLVCKNSDPILIYKFIVDQLDTAYEDFKIDHENIEYSLYFKCFYFYFYQNSFVVTFLFNPKRDPYWK